tara:strand:+ start:664 stop:1608 length:945 start_codon:yes stop_codon:yes gene_type:complete
MTDIKKWIDERGLHKGDYLGDLCRNNHEYLDTGKSIRCQRTVRKGSKSGKEQKNGKCICCIKVGKDKHYLSHKEEKKNYYKKNKEDILQKKKEKNRLNMLDPVYRENIIEYKRKRRREQGCELREEITLRTAIKRAGAPTVIELINKQMKEAQAEARLEYLKTPEGKEKIKDQNRRKTNHLYAISFSNKTMHKEKKQRRKALERGNYAEKISTQQLINRFALFNNCCAYCGSYEGSDIQQEHVICHSVGGPHCLANIVPACASCNKDKHTKNMETWYEKQPFYSKERLDKIKKVLALTPFPTKQTEMFHDWQIQ